MTETDKQIIEKFREKFPKIEVANYGQLPGSGATWKMGIIGKYSVKGQVEDFILAATAKTLKEHDEKLVEEMKKLKSGTSGAAVEAVYWYNQAIDRAIELVKGEK